MNELRLDKVNRISFRQLSACSMTNCVEDKIVLVDGLFRFPFGEAKESVVIADFIVLLFCTEGYFEVDMDGRHYRLCQGNILFCSQGVTLCDAMMSTACNGRMLCVSWEYAQKLFLRSTCQWDNILQLRHNPLLRPDICEQELYRAYYRLFSAKLNCHSYTNGIDGIFQSLFYDLYRITERYAMQKSTPTSLRQEDLFKRFITLLKEKYSREHFCSYYAEQLCVTPKYLTTIVKKVSGKSVSQWINTYLMDQIKIQLKTTSLTVAEIADKLNFSNASFFGKYVKMHTGKSPSKLRRKMKEMKNEE